MESSGCPTVDAAFDALDAAVDAVNALSLDGVRGVDLLTVLARAEYPAWRQPAFSHRIIARVAAEVSPDELGAKNLATAIAERLSISSAEARRRIEQARDLGPRMAISGEPLEPQFAATSNAQSEGRIGPEHVKLIRQFFDALPEAVDHTTREQAETTLVRIAAEQRPEGLKVAADRLLALLHPDGDLPNDSDRARKRDLTIGRQGVDGMSKISGWLTPEGRATIDPILSKWAAPGMCNLDDPNPTVDGTPSQDAIAGDHRSTGQRNHDALMAMGRSILASGELGQHNGLRATIIVTTTLAELESGAGQAVTAGGTLLPIPDLIKLASHAYHYLCVFDTHTEEALYVGRSKRIATPGQRIALLAKFRGCTKPGCTASGYRCQAHHAVLDWVDGGQTNIDELTLACPPDNRLVKKNGYRTRKRKDGRTEWIPPPHLDRGQARVNDYHHPERMLADPDPPDLDPD